MKIEFMQQLSMRRLFFTLHKANVCNLFKQVSVPDVVSVVFCER